MEQWNDKDIISLPKVNNLIVTKLSKSDIALLTSTVAKKGDVFRDENNDLVYLNQDPVSDPIDLINTTGTIKIFVNKQYDSRFLRDGTLPKGWLVCDGRAISRTSYSELFDKISTTYGSGNGTTTFNIPHLGDKYIRCANADSLVGHISGQSEVRLARSQLPDHHHSFLISGGSGTEIRILNTGSGSGTSTTEYIGGSDSHENKPKSMCVQFIIKY